MKYFQMTSLFYMIVSLVVLLAVRVGLSNYQARLFSDKVENLFCTFKVSTDDVVNIETKKTIRSTNNYYKKYDNSKSQIVSTKANAKSSKQIELQKPKDYNPISKGQKVEITKPVIAKQSVEKLNINTASKEELMSLNGIGEVFSTRIIKFKDRLGGFYSTSQLLDVYGFPPETYDQLKEQLFCSGAVTKIDIKEIDFKQLLRHPYTDYEQTKGLKNYVRYKGSIDTIEKLIDATDMPSEQAQKFFPYIFNEKV